jgi:hypothetical protein
MTRSGHLDTQYFFVIYLNAKDVKIDCCAQKKDTLGTLSVCPATGDDRSSFDSSYIRCRFLYISRAKPGTWLPYRAIGISCGFVLGRGDYRSHKSARESNHS